MIRWVVYLLWIFKMFHGLMNNPVLYYNIITLWDHRRICGRLLTEKSLCDAYLYWYSFLNIHKYLCVLSPVRVLVNNQLDVLFSCIYLFISSLYMFRASQCSSSGDRIVLLHHLVWLVCVSDCLVPRSHFHRLVIPDDVQLIQFDLLMMRAVMLETCREMK